MVLRAHKFGLVFTVFLVGLTLGAGTGFAATEFSLADQGWRVVEQEGRRTVELCALVVNQSQLPLQYEVQFIVERGELPLQTRRAGQPSKEGSQPPEPVWSAIKTTSVRGDPLAAGTSGLIKTSIPYDLLRQGKAYRFRAELHDISASAVVAGTTITCPESPFAAGAGLAGATVASLGSALAAGVPPAGATVRSLKGLFPAASVPSGPAVGAPDVLVQALAPGSVSGSGHMVGTHESHRVGDQWVEHGSGTINVDGAFGRMVLSYTYDSRGPSAATLTATAKGSGTLIPRRGRPLPVQVTSAWAQMTAPGGRWQAGPIITRSGARATGTFSGTVGSQPWTGLLTMTEGIMRLNLVTNTGTHSFKIQFTASQ